MKGSPTNPIWERGKNGEKWCAFDNVDGSLICDPINYPLEKQLWRQIADPLELSVQCVGWKKTYRSGHFLWRDTVTGAVHPMFMKDFINLLQAGHLTGILIIGKFSVVKRGRYYGINFLGD